MVVIVAYIFQALPCIEPAKKPYVKRDVFLLVTKHNRYIFSSNRYYANPVFQLCVMRWKLVCSGLPFNADFEIYGENISVCNCFSEASICLSPLFITD